MAIRKISRNLEWITVLFSLFVGASYAFAESKSTISAEYGSISTTYSVGANSAKLDLSGTSIRARINLSKTISVSGATSSMSGDLSGINMELNNTSFAEKPSTGILNECLSPIATLIPILRDV